ncbi:MAG TPA: hypothetical protein VFC42_08165 [Methylomirabilota bacterium]|nr:hypothetical protein [Methylomirabilota bacterium]
MPTRSHSQKPTPRLSQKVETVPAIRKSASSLTTRCPLRMNSATRASWKIFGTGSEVWKGAPGMPNKLLL